MVSRTVMPLRLACSIALLCASPALGAQHDSVRRFHPDAITALEIEWRIEQLGSPYNAVRARASHRLRSGWQAAFIKLRAARTDPNPDVRNRVELLLAEFAPRMESEIAGLLQRLEHSSELITTTELLGIARFCGFAHRKQLAVLIAGRAPPRDRAILESAATDSDSVTRWVASRALSSWAHNPDKASWLANLNDEDPEIRLLGIEALIHSSDRRALEAAIDLLAATEAHVRSRAYAHLRSATGLPGFRYRAYGDDTLFRGAAIRRWREWFESTR